MILKNSTSFWSEKPFDYEIETLQSFAKINPLVGLPPKTLRLYSALGILKKEYSAGEKPGWFRLPESNKRLKSIGLSKQGLKNALQELVEADLLQIRTEHASRLYYLK